MPPEAAASRMEGLADAVVRAAREREERLVRGKRKWDGLLGDAKRLLVPRAALEARAWESNGHELAYREESALISARIEEIKVELLRQSHLEKEAEKARKEAEAERRRQAELRRVAKEREEAARAAQEEAARAALQAKREQEAREAAAEEAKQAEEAANRRDAKDLVAEAMERRRACAARKAEVAKFSKKFKKMVNACRMMIQMTGETVKAVKLGYNGNGKNLGAGLFLVELQKKLPEAMPLGMHVVAESILKQGTTGTAPDCIKSGETKFALVYLMVILSVNFPGFYQVYEEVLFSMCPYSVPGLREAVVAEAPAGDRDAMRAALGYQADEKAADYIARMQACVGFQAGVYQTSVDILAKDPFTMVPVGSKHPSPFGGLVEAWRWLALTVNRPAFRWTPYLVQAFVAVAGFELTRHAGKQTAKLARLLASEAFIARCRAVGEYDLKKEDNDVDRMSAYKQYFERVTGEQGGRFAPPGRERDVRQLVLDVTSNAGRGK